MKPRTLILIVLAMVTIGLGGVPSQSPVAPQQQVFTPASAPEINIRKQCSLPHSSGRVGGGVAVDLRRLHVEPASKEASADGSVMTSPFVRRSLRGPHPRRAREEEPGRHDAPHHEGRRPRRRSAGSQAVGEVPEAAETLTRYDASYPFMNEKQVIMGETTIGGRRELSNDEGLFDIMELQRLALERASTAREAIQDHGRVRRRSTVTATPASASRSVTRPRSGTSRSSAQAPSTRARCGRRCASRRVTSA